MGFHPLLFSDQESPGRFPHLHCRLLVDDQAKLFREDSHSPRYRLSLEHRQRSDFFAPGNRRGWRFSVWAIWGSSQRQGLRLRLHRAGSNMSRDPPIGPRAWHNPVQSFNPRPPRHHEVSAPSVAWPFLLVGRVSRFVPHNLILRYQLGVCVAKRQSKRFLHFQPIFFYGFNWNGLMGPTGSSRRSETSSFLSPASED